LIGRVVVKKRNAKSDLRGVGARRGGIDRLA
jgi:hypothetical protein